MRPADDRSEVLVAHESRRRFDERWRAELCVEAFMQPAFGPHLPSELARLGFVRSEADVHPSAAAASSTLAPVAIDQVAIRRDTDETIPGMGGEAHRRGAAHGDADVERSLRSREDLRAIDARLRPS
jgi:hypothetical protein